MDPRAPDGITIYAIANTQGLLSRLQAARKYIDQHNITDHPGSIFVVMGNVVNLEDISSTRATLAAVRKAEMISKRNTIPTSRRQHVVLGGDNEEVLRQRSNRSDRIDRNVGKFSKTKPDSPVLRMMIDWRNARNKMLQGLNSGEKRFVISRPAQVFEAGDYWFGFSSPVPEGRYGILSHEISSNFMPVIEPTCMRLGTSLLSGVTILRLHESERDLTIIGDAGLPSEQIDPIEHSSHRMMFGSDRKANNYRKQSMALPNEAVRTVWSLKLRIPAVV